MLKEMERNVIKWMNKKGKSYTEIGSEVGCHRETVAKVIKEPINKKYERECSGSQLEKYREQIEKWIKSELKVNRMLEKAREELEPLYEGSRSIFYEYVGKLKRELNEKGIETWVRFEGLPGEYLQVDWGEVRKFPFVNKEYEIRYIFAARLKYSRIIYVEFHHDMKLETLIRCLIRCFEYIGGVPWSCVFDNMKTVITCRDAEGKPIWNESFGKFSNELEFHRQVCDRGCGNQKGSVENLVKLVKNNFVGGREFLNDKDLAKRCKEWVEKINSSESQSHKKIPKDLLKIEQEKFIPLLVNSNDYGFILTSKVNQESRIYVENNIYSVPIEYTGQSVIVRLTEERVKVYDIKGKKCIADHRRRFGKGEKEIEISHYEDVLKKKPKAKAMLYRDFLIEQDKIIQTFISNLCFRRRGVEAFGPDMVKMYELYKRHGKEDFLAAITLSSEWECYGSEYLEYLLEVPHEGRSSSILKLSGIPAQREIDRSLSEYMKYTKGGVN